MMEPNMMYPLAMLIGHLWGDYVLQDSWMAYEKKTNKLALFVHCTVYTACVVGICFAAGLLLPWWAIAAVWIAHLINGTWLIERYFAWFNKVKIEDCPLFLRIIIDNTVHLTTMLVILLILFGRG